MIEGFYDPVERIEELNRPRNRLKTILRRAGKWTFWSAAVVVGAVVLLVLWESGRFDGLLNSPWFLILLAAGLLASQLQRIENKVDEINRRIERLQSRFGDGY